MKHVLVLVTLALASLSAACDTSTAASTGSGAEEERKITSSPAKDPRLVLGDTATTAENGTTLAVLSYESPSTVEGASPERGFEFSGIEVKGCAGPDSENSLMHIGPGAFVLRMPDGTRLQPEEFGEKSKIREPALESMNPGPGECGRGFVTFQTPTGERPDLVLYDEQFVLKSTIAWKVPEKR
ncbi:MAG: hypothetical protein M3479_08050 [Actinomycetota bacterium]|nr:hypothetical protein [Actinomycetota bacterium]